MSKDLSAICYQDNKERLQKNIKNIKVFLKKKKKKSGNMVVKQKLVEYRKKYYKMRKNALLAL